VADLLRAARGTRMLTLCGPGGIGKTRLLRRLAEMLAGEYDEAFLVRVGDLSDPGLVPGRVAAALRVGEEPGVPLPETLAEALRGRRLVLAVDGCGQRLAQACARLCAGLLAKADGLLVVAASREPLGVPGETVAPVSALGLPTAGEADPGRAAQSDAVRLFAARAAAADPGFRLDAANCAAITRLCRAVGGVPLAIELAAAGIRDQGAGPATAGVAARLPAEPASETGQADAAARQAAALEAVIGWAHDSLSPAEQVLLRRLSVFEGWSLEMAERVCSDEGLPAVQVTGLLAGLARRSLIEPESGRAGLPAGTGVPGGSRPPGETALTGGAELPLLGERPGRPSQARYRMPGAIRDYGAACLDRAGETDAVRRRLRDYTDRLAEYMTSLGMARVPSSWPVLKQVFSSYDTDAGNFRAVLAWCVEHGDAETGLRICTAVRLSWLVRGARREGERWFDAFLGADQAAVPDAVRGPALVSRAQLAFCAADMRRTREWASAGLDLCRAARDPYFRAAAMDLLAKTELAAGRPEEALRLVDDAIEETRQSDDRWHRGFLLGTRCFALAVLGRLPEARQWTEAGLALMQEIDNRWGVAQFRVGLGNLARALGDPETACEHYRAALPFMRAEMPATETAACLASLGRAALRMGDPGGARAAMAESLRLSLTAGSRSGISRGLLGFASLAVREGRPDLAVLLAAAVTALCREAGRRPPPKARVRRYLDAAAEQLGADETGPLWEAGLRLSSREAASLALEPPAVSRAGARAARS
jgi:predicted ATPase